MVEGRPGENAAGNSKISASYAGLKAGRYWALHVCSLELGGLHCDPALVSREFGHPAGGN